MSDTDITLSIGSGSLGILDASTTNSSAPNGNPFGGLSGAAAIFSNTDQQFVLNTAIPISTISFASTTPTQLSGRDGLSIWPRV